MPVHRKRCQVASVVRLLRGRIEPIGPVDPVLGVIAGAEVDVLGEGNDGNIDVAGVLRERAELVDETAGSGDGIFQSRHLVVLRHRTRIIEHQRHAHLDVAPSRGRRRAKAQRRETDYVHEIGCDRAGPGDLDRCGGGRCGRGIGRADRNSPVGVVVGKERVEIVLCLLRDVGGRDGALRQVPRKHQGRRVQRSLHRRARHGGAAVVDRGADETQEGHQRDAEHDRDITFIRPGEAAHRSAEITGNG